TLAVSELRSTEQLRTSEERYRRIVESTAEGIWQIDAAGTVAFANEHLARMVGIDRDQLIGRSAGEFLHEQDRALLLDPLRCEPERHEVRVLRSDQSLLWGECVAVPITDESGTLTGMLGMLTDISDRVRSRELEQQLDQMSRLDSLGQLAGGISHDFKNLLLVVG